MAKQCDRISRLAVPGDQRAPIVFPPLAAQQRTANAQSRRPGDLDNAGIPVLCQSRLWCSDKRHVDRFRNHATCSEQGIRRIHRQPGVARALDNHVGKAIEGFHRLRGQ